jgi:hypothetical protein
MSVFTAGNALIPGALSGVTASPALCASDRRRLMGGIWFKQNGVWPVWMPAGINNHAAELRPKVWRGIKPSPRIIFVSFRRKLQETILHGCKIVSGVQRGYPSGLRDFEKVPSKLPAFYKPVKLFSGPRLSRFSPDWMETKLLPHKMGRPVPAYIAKERLSTSNILSVLYGLYGLYGLCRTSRTYCLYTLYG